VARDGTRPWSVWLRRYRAERDLTQEELGEALGVDGKTVSAWENGQRPGRRHARTICSKLRTTRAELGLADVSAGPLVGRRDFLRLSASVGSLALFGPWAGADQVDAAAVEGFEAATDTLGRLLLRVGPSAMLGAALGHVESVTRLLQGSLSGEVRLRLCAVLAETSALLAVCKSRLGDAAGADHFGMLAVAAARESGDPDLGVRALLAWTSADRSLAARPEVALGRYEEGEFGLRVAEAGVASRAWAAALAAGVHATRGDASASLAALERAAALLAEPAKRYPWPDTAWLAGERAVSLARLGRPAEARAALAVALSATGPERQMDRVRWAVEVVGPNSKRGPNTE
jgi:transcriptional regulator with XRE-family HTH domain